MVDTDPQSYGIDAPSGNQPGCPAARWTTDVVAPWSHLDKFSDGETLPRSDSTFCLVGQPRTSNKEAEPGRPGCLWSWSPTWGSRRTKNTVCCFLPLPVVAGPFRQSSLPCLSVCVSEIDINRKARGATPSRVLSIFHLIQPWQFPRLSHFEGLRQEHLICTTRPPSALKSARLHLLPPNKTYLLGPRLLVSSSFCTHLQQ
ncbi:hypothetical protein B0T13DRAFT_93068 [Neurospora crassa]|nr:hypothetical protein B0T13DRAFT_93068 [Neurospora crassa]